MGYVMSDTAIRNFVEGYEKEVAELLNKAADLLERPGGWTQKTFARDEGGMPVQTGSRDAVSFCTLGALARVGAGHDTEYRALRVLNHNLEEYGPGIHTWNDHPSVSQSDVVAKLREVAAKVDPKSKAHPIAQATGEPVVIEELETV